MTCSLVPFFTKLGTLTSFRTTEVVPEIEKRLVALVLASSMYVYMRVVYPRVSFEFEFQVLEELNQTLILTRSQK